MAQFFVTFGLFALAPDVGSAYLMQWAGTSPDFPADFPALTVAALPLLRVAPPDPHNRPVTLWWVWVVWGVVLVLPLLTAAATMRAKDLGSAGRGFSAGSWLWATLLLALAAFIAIGCVLPFACV